MLSKPVTTSLKSRIWYAHYETEPRDKVNNVKSVLHLCEKYREQWYSHVMGMAFRVPTKLEKCRTIHEAVYRSIWLKVNLLNICFSVRFGLSIPQFFQISLFARWVRTENYRIFLFNTVQLNVNKFKCPTKRYKLLTTRIRYKKMAKRHNNTTCLTYG